MGTATYTMDTLGEGECCCCTLHDLVMVTLGCGHHYCYVCVGRNHEETHECEASRVMFLVCPHPRPISRSVFPHDRRHGTYYR